MTVATKGGTACLGSPTPRSIAGLPGAVSAISSAGRTKGERVSTTRPAEKESSRSTLFIGIRIYGRVRSAASMDHRSAEVKTRLTIGVNRQRGKKKLCPTWKRVRGIFRALIIAVRQRY